jgi:hypothetical protein
MERGTNLLEAIKRTFHQGDEPSYSHPREPKGVSARQQDSVDQR